MRFKDSHLLGVLVVVTGVILLFAWLGGGGRQGHSPAGGGPAASRAAPPGEETLDDWLRLTQQPQQPATGQPTESQGTIHIQGRGPDESVSPPPPAPPVSPESRINTRLEQTEPEEIPLEEPAEEQPREQQEPPSTPARPKVHVVQRGDTLIKLSRQYYHTPARWKAILEANRGLIEKPEDLRPDMKLVIPELEPVQASGVSSESGPPTLTGRALPPGARYYDVKKGDTLWGIAARFYGDGEAWKKILEANSDLLKEPKDLREGMRLILP